MINWGMNLDIRLCDTKSSQDSQWGSERAGHAGNRDFHPCWQVMSTFPHAINADNMGSLDFNLHTLITSKSTVITCMN